MNYSNLLYNHFLSNVDNKHDYIYGNYLGGLAYDSDIIMILVVGYIL